MVGILLAAAAAGGTYLLYTAVAFGWRGIGRRSLVSPSRRARPLRSWLRGAGLEEVPVAEFVGAIAALAVVGAAIGAALFGTLLPAVAGATLAAALPVASYRRRREVRRAEAQDAWPRLIEEIRILTGSAGRSVPQALFEAGRGAPQGLRAAFDAAQREWALTTDFDRAIQVLKARLADPTADAACETLLVAHHIGGTDIDRRLEALAEDRRQDAQGRKDARARQAGVRFARWFTVVVPLGMAVVGLTIGDGRAAYQTVAGQAVVLAGLVLMTACWLWASRILRLPAERRVFDR